VFTNFRYIFGVLGISIDDFDVQLELLEPDINIPNEFIIVKNVGVFKRLPNNWNAVILNHSVRQSLGKT
jgi:hypothetical protein